MAALCHQNPTRRADYPQLLGHARHRSRKSAVFVGFEPENQQCRQIFVGERRKGRTCSLVDASPTFERSAECDLVGILKIASDRQTTRQS